MSRIDLYPNAGSASDEAQLATGTAFPGGKVAQDVNLLGGTIDAVIAAPTGPFFITGFDVTDVAADPLAGSPLADRTALSIRNKSATVTIYFGNSNVTADDNNVTGGWEIGPQEDFNIDLNDSETVYLVAPAGQTAHVKILEIAST